jgi:hypothetical protein
MNLHRVFDVSARWQMDCPVQSLPMEGRSSISKVGEAFRSPWTESRPFLMITTLSRDQCISPVTQSEISEKWMIHRPMGKAEPFARLGHGKFLKRGRGDRGFFARDLSFFLTRNIVTRISQSARWVNYIRFASHQKIIFISDFSRNAFRFYSDQEIMNREIFTAWS